MGVARENIVEDTRQPGDQYCNIDLNNPKNLSNSVREFSLHCPWKRKFKDFTQSKYSTIKTAVWGFTFGSVKSQELHDALILLLVGDLYSKNAAHKDPGKNKLVECNNTYGLTDQEYKTECKEDSTCISKKREACGPFLVKLNP